MFKRISIASLLVFVLAMCALPAFGGLSVATNGGTLIGTATGDNATVELDCNGYDGIWVGAEITVKGSTNLSVTYKVYDQRIDKWTDVMAKNPVTSIYAPDIGYLDNSTSASPGFYLPLPRNADKVRALFDACDGCTASVFLNFDDVSK